MSDEWKVKCPLKGHDHEIKLTVNPENPDRVIGYCNKRAVIEMDRPKPTAKYRRSYSRKSQGD